MQINEENKYYKAPQEPAFQKENITSLNVEISSQNFNNKTNTIEEERKKKEYLYVKIFCIIIYYALVILIEQAYRESLFEKSIDSQEDIRKDHDKGSAFYDFFKFMSVFGLAKLTFPVFLIIFLFFPLSSSFLTLQVLIYSIYLTNLFKIIYRNGRPYWESDILDIVCNSGYGNPSGHSVTSAAYYLTLPHIVTNFEYFRKSTKGLILKIIIFCLFIIIGALCIISRVILSAHSINQIIYGFTLGLGIYFICIHIISYHTYHPNEFIIHITNTIIIIVYMVLHLGLLILLIIIYFSLDDNGKIKSNVESNIFNGDRCKVKDKYLMLRHDGFFQALAITSLLGAHLGIILLVIVLKKYNYVINEYITEFNKSSVQRWLKRLPILIISGVFIILNFCIPGDSKLSIVFLFKSALSFFFTTLGIYFIGIFLSIHCNLANENITRTQN